MLGRSRDPAEPRITTRDTWSATREVCTVASRPPTSIAAVVHSSTPVAPISPVTDRSDGRVPVVTSPAQVATPTASETG